MKIGINMFLWTDFVNEDHFKYFEELKKIGYDGVEIPIFKGDSKHYLKLKNVLNDCGLTCTATTACLPDKNIISSENFVRTAGIEHLKWAIDMASILEAEILGGPIHSAPGIFTGNGPTCNELKYCAEGLTEVGNYATKANLILSVEYLNRFECYLTNSIKQTKELIQSIGLSNVGILYDTHHAHYEEYSVSAAMNFGGKAINHIQLSESNRGIPGKGQVNWDETFASIRAIGYDNWLIIESFNRYHDNLRRNLFLWRELYTDPSLVYKAGIDLVRKFHCKK